MPFAVSLEGGPYAAKTLQLEATPNDSFGLPVDQRGMPCGNPPFGLAIYAREAPDGMIFTFQQIRSATGQPFAIEFVDGPAKGLHPAEQPAAYLDQIQRVAVTSEESVYRGQGVPAGFAVYERRQDAGAWKYYFVEIDRSPESLQALIEEENDRKATEAIHNFYAAPNDDIYTMKPTGEHVQVPVEVGQRRGHVDEAIAPLIRALWELGRDTLGSCQQRPPGHDHEGKAYVGFPKEKDGIWFRDLLEAAKINCIFDAKILTVAREGPNGEVAETLKLPAPNVIFSSADIGRIVELLN